jgi:hypothetical protein
MGFMHTSPRGIGPKTDRYLYFWPLHTGTKCSYFCSLYSIQTLECGSALTEDPKSFLRMYTKSMLSLLFRLVPTLPPCYDRLDINATTHQYRWSSTYQHLQYHCGHWGHVKCLWDQEQVISHIIALAKDDSCAPLLLVHPTAGRW